MAFKTTNPNSNLFFPGVPSGTVIDDSGNFYVNDLTIESFSDQSVPFHAGTNQLFITGGSAHSPNPSTPPFVVNTIQKFPFSIVSGSGTDVGEMSIPPTDPGGTATGERGFFSETAGYKMSGSAVPVSHRNTIHKFNFASATSYSSVGPLGAMAGGNTIYMSTFSSKIDNKGFGYVPVDPSGPFNPSSLFGHLTSVAFASDSISVETQQLGSSGTTKISTTAAGHSGPTKGFFAGGYENYHNPGPFRVKTSEIKSFPYAAPSNSISETGELIFDLPISSDITSPDHGFLVGINYEGPGPAVDTTHADIQKYPFSIGPTGTATDVGEIYSPTIGPPALPTPTRDSAATRGSVGSTASNGFQASGGSTTAGNLNPDAIRKFPFSITSGAATEVGELHQAVIGGTGFTD